MPGVSRLKRRGAPVIGRRVRETNAAGGKAGGNVRVREDYLSSIPICQPRGVGDAYLPLLLSLGAVDEAEPLLDDAPLDGVALDDEPDEAGGVADIADDDEPVPEVDGVDGLLDALDDDDPLGVELVEGVDDEDDDEGDGVTVGGVVLLVDVSRLQPAMPSASPAQSSVTNVVFISNPP